MPPELIISKERIRDLREWGSSEQGMKYLEVHTENYRAMRARWGFKP